MTTDQHTDALRPQAFPTGAVRLVATTLFAAALLTIALWPEQDALAEGTLILNEPPPRIGLNAASWLGGTGAGGAAAEVAQEANLQLGQHNLVLQAVWMLASGEWLYYLPGAAAASTLGVVPPVAGIVLVAGTASTTVSRAELIYGFSVQGRALRAMRLSQGPSAVVLIGGLHTEEEMNSAALAQAVTNRLLAEPTLIPAAVSVYIVPLANPDGAARGSHLNANGVDLNRNWPTDNWQTVAVHPPHGEVSGGAAPLSEPETAALYVWLRDLRPVAVVAWHSAAALVEHNHTADAERLAGAYAVASEYRLVEKWPYYPITGELIHAMAELGIAAFDVELSDHETIEFDRNMAGVLATLHAIAGY